MYFMRNCIIEMILEKTNIIEKLLFYQESVWKVSSYFSSLKEENLKNCVSKTVDTIISKGYCLASSFEKEFGIVYISKLLEDVDVLII